MRYCQRPQPADPGRTLTPSAPTYVIQRVTDSSGAKYGAGGDAANTQRGGPIGPVGSSYKPVGAPDIKSMQSGAKKDVIEPVGSSYTPARNELSSIRSGATSTPSAPPPAPRQAPAAVTQPAPAPAPAPAPRPAQASVPPAPRPTAPAASATPASQPEDDRIKPVGTSCENLSGHALYNETPLTAISTFVTRQTSPYEWASRAS